MPFTEILTDCIDGLSTRDQSEGILEESSSHKRSRSNSRSSLNPLLEASQSRSRWIGRLVEQIQLSKVDDGDECRSGIQRNPAESLAVFQHQLKVVGSAVEGFGGSTYEQNHRIRCVSVAVGWVLWVVGTGQKMGHSFRGAGCHTPAETQLAKHRNQQVEVECNNARPYAGEELVESGRVGGEAKEAAGTERETICKLLFFL